MSKSGKKTIELSALIVVYVLFAGIGVYSGQTIIDIDLIGPSDGMEFRSSPVELVARLTVKGAPLSDVQARFIIRSQTGSESNADVFTDADGIAKLLVPASSGNYTWHVTASREGYPRIVSLSRSFTIELSLVVEALLPSRLTLAFSPVDFVARVTDERGLVESANVTFLVDSVVVGTANTGKNGIARLSSPVSSGSHTWFATANKDGEGGLSDVVPFVVGQLASLAGNLALEKLPLPAVLLPRNTDATPHQPGFLQLADAILCKPLEKLQDKATETRLAD